jgi:hypothetical protein
MFVATTIMDVQNLAATQPPPLATFHAQNFPSSNTFCTKSQTKKITTPPPRLHIQTNHKTHDKQTINNFPHCKPKKKKPMMSHRSHVLNTSPLNPNFLGFPLKL